jgi:hypothetical protein
MYYFRSRPAVDAIKFTLNVEELLKATDGNDTDKVLKCLDNNNNITNTPSTPNKEVKKEEVKIIEEEQEGCLNCGS